MPALLRESLDNQEEIRRSPGTGVLTGLARWEAFHAEGGYAEPPASLVRIFMFRRQIPA